MDFKIGDIVRLKSGGPPMTVDEVDKRAASQIIACLWFDGAQLEDGEFSPASLVLVTNEEAATGESYTVTLGKGGEASGAKLDFAISGVGGGGESTP